MKHKFRIYALAVTIFTTYTNWSNAGKAIRSSGGSSWSPISSSSSSSSSGGYHGGFSGGGGHK